MDTDQELSNDDIYDQYFNDDDDRDPEFIPPWEQQKKRRGSHKYNVSVEEVESSSEDEKTEPGSILLEHQINSNTSNDGRVAGNDISTSKRKDIYESSSSDFDLPEDYLKVINNKKTLNSKNLRKSNINQTKRTDKARSQSKEKRTSKEKISRSSKGKTKKDDNQASKEVHKYQTLEYKNHLHLLSNLDPLFFHKYDRYDEKAKNIEYFSSIMESNEHKYILHILPIFFNRILLYHIRLLSLKHKRNDLIGFANFCFGIRKYLETLINLRVREREYLRKRSDEVFRHLVRYKEKQYCLLLACEYFVKSQIENTPNFTWTLERFCDITQSSQQRIKPKFWRRPKVVDLTDDMQGILQVFQKVVAVYEDFQKASTDLDTSVNIETNFDELEDTLSVISEKSSFSTGSQILQTNDYEDTVYDKNDHNAAEKRINFLARLEIPSQLFTSSNFDWAGKMYLKVIEDYCDGYGDYTALAAFHKALQYRLDQNIFPESKRIHNLLMRLSDKENNFATSKFMIESQLGNDLQLDEKEIQIIYNQLEDHPLQMENEGVSEEDSITEDASDYSEHNYSGAHKDTDNSDTQLQKMWLLQQYRKLGSKLVTQLDDKPLITNGVHTLICTTLRSVILNLLRYAENGTEKENNDKWFRDNFTLSRMIRWNSFHFCRVIESNKMSANNERAFFVDKFVTTMFGETLEKNPIVHQKRRQLESLLEFNDMEDEAKESIDEHSIRQEQNSLEDELEFIRVFDIPVLSRPLYQNVVLYRDMGLLYEYPKEVSVHVVLKFIKQPEHNLIIGRDVDENESRGLNQDSWENDNEFPEISRNEMLLSTLIVKHLTNENQANLGSSVMRYINEATNIIKEKSRTSIVNMFYMKQETNDLIDIFRQNYQKYKPNRKGKYSEELYGDEIKNETINVLLRYLSGDEWSSSNKIDGKLAVNWAKKERSRMKRLWNFSPFESKAKQLLDNPRNYVIGNLNEDVIINSTKLLHTLAWTPLRLESAINQTCQLKQLETYSVALKDLFNGHFSCLLY